MKKIVTLAFVAALAVASAASIGCGGATSTAAPASKAAK